MVAIFLPLSSLWASAALDGRPSQQGSSSLPRGSKRKLFTSSYASGSTTAACTTTSSGNGLKSCGGTVTSPAGTDANATGEKGGGYDDDLEAQACVQRAQNGVRVDKSFSVERSSRPVT